VAIDDLLAAWAGTAYRHIPAGSPFDVLDLRLAGRGRDNRWNDEGDRTLYLAGDQGVAVAEFGRHLQSDRSPDRRLVSQARQIFRLSVVLERVLDLRDPPVHDALSLVDAPRCFLDKGLARATARYIRRATSAQAILVPSVAFLDQIDRWVLVLFIESLPPDPRTFITAVEPDAIFRVEP
jgi:RES domain-containing protein